MAALVLLAAGARHRADTLRLFRAKLCLVQLLELLDVLTGREEARRCARS